MVKQKVFDYFRTLCGAEDYTTAMSYISSATKHGGMQPRKPLMAMRSVLYTNVGNISSELWATFSFFALLFPSIMRVASEKFHLLHKRFC